MYKYWNGETHQLYSTHELRERILYYSMQYSTMCLYIVAQLVWHFASNVKP